MALKRRRNGEQRAATAKANGLDSMLNFQTARWFGDRFRLEHADLVDAAARVFLANDPDCYAATCEMLGDADLRPYLPAFRMPVAVVVGEEDYATPIAAARELHEAISGSTLTILKGRHLTPIECPDQIAGILRPARTAERNSVNPAPSSAAASPPN